MTGTIDLAQKGVDTSTASLGLPRWTLDYGLYKVMFNMSMGSDPALTFTASAYR